MALRERLEFGVDHRLLIKLHIFMRKILVAVLVIVVSLNLLSIYILQQRSVTSNPKPRVIRIPSSRIEVPGSEEEPSEPEEILPEFVDVPVFRKESEESIYSDVISHSSDRPFGNANGRATNVHETAHGIHSWLRNKHGKNVNGFYCLEGRGVILEEPNIHKRDVAKFVPENLKSYRYSLYITGQRAWDGQPLYIYDEWIAYTLGAMTNVDDVNNDRYKGAWTDGVSGSLEFSIYSVALCMAVAELDSEYWKENEQFRVFTIFNLRRAKEVFLAGHRMEKFKWDKQDQLLHALLTSDSAKPMRDFIQENLDGVWLDVSPVSLEIMKYESHQMVSQPVEHCVLISP